MNETKVIELKSESDCDSDSESVSDGIKSKLNIKPYLLPVEHSEDVPPHVSIVIIDEEIQLLKLKVYEVH